MTTHPSWVGITLRILPNRKQFSECEADCETCAEPYYRPD